MPYFEMEIKNSINYIYAFACYDKNVINCLFVIQQNCE